MEQHTAPKHLPTLIETPDLFQVAFDSSSNRHRLQEQTARLSERAKEVASMLDRLDGQLSVDREQAVAMLAEYTGLLELVLEDIRIIRDIDESFGGRPRRRSPLAQLSLQLERGLAYLLGIFSVLSSSEELPDYNWTLVQRDVQEVLDTSLKTLDSCADRQNGKSGSQDG